MVGHARSHGWHQRAGTLCVRPFILMRIAEMSKRWIQDSLFDVDSDQNGKVFSFFEVICHIAKSCISTDFGQIPRGRLLVVFLLDSLATLKEITSLLLRTYNAAPKKDSIQI